MDEHPFVSLTPALWAQKRVDEAQRTRAVLEDSLGVRCGHVLCEPIAAAAATYPVRSGGEDDGTAATTTTLDNDHPLSREAHATMPGVCVLKRLSSWEKNQFSDILLCRVQSPLAATATASRSFSPLSERGGGSWDPSLLRPSINHDENSRVCQWCTQVIVKNVAMNKTTLRCTRGGCTSRRALQSTEWVERLALACCTRLVERLVTPCLPYLYVWYGVGIPRLSREFTTSRGAGHLPTAFTTAAASSMLRKARNALGAGRDARVNSHHGGRMRDSRRSRTSIVEQMGVPSGAIRAARRHVASKIQNAASERVASTMASATTGVVPMVPKRPSPSRSMLAARSLVFALEYVPGGNWSDYMDAGRHMAWPDAQWHVFLFHLFASLYAMQKYFGITHHDMHLGNVLLMPLQVDTVNRTVATKDAAEDDPTTAMTTTAACHCYTATPPPYVFEYRIDGRQYTLPACPHREWMPVAADWGVAHRPGGVVQNTDFYHVHDEDSERGDASRLAADYMHILLLLAERTEVTRQRFWRTYRPLTRVDEPPVLRDALVRLFHSRFDTVLIPTTTAATTTSSVLLGQFDMDQSIGNEWPAMPWYADETAAMTVTAQPPTSSQTDDV